MQLLIKNATLVFPGSKMDGEVVDISIMNGQISAVGIGLSVKDATVIEVKNAHVSPGWFDLGTLVGDPGLEQREDFDSVGKAAAAGGFTTLACLPNTSPAIHAKSEVQYVIGRSAYSLVGFLPIGAVSRDCAGKEITEMYDMQAAGAVAFSDGKKSIHDSGLMLRALQYVQPFDGVILNHPHDRSMAPSGQMHEGIMSASLGMKGIPALAEELMLRRDIYLAEYTGSKVHALNISTAGAVELVREAKTRGLKVTASVAAMNLACDDHLLHEFDPNFKVMPPVRELSDVEALHAGLADGTIDCITSNHTPLDPEAKNLEFPFADFGAIGLETVFGLSWVHLQHSLTIGQLIEKLAIAPRKLLGLAVPQLGPGVAANLTLFDPAKEWTFTAKDIYSKSKNTPFIGWSMKGKVLGVFNNNSYWMASH